MTLQVCLLPGHGQPPQPVLLAAAGQHGERAGGRGVPVVCGARGLLGVTRVTFNLVKLSPQLMRDCNVAVYA